MTEKTNAATTIITNKTYFLSNRLRPANRSNSIILIVKFIDDKPKEIDPDVLASIPTNI